MPSSFKNQTITTTRRNKMKKALLALLSIAIAFTAMQPSQAEDQKVLAIIDTAIDSSKFPSVIQEACFTSAVNQACLNGQLFMEGKGAASISAWPKTKLSPVYHGHNMAAVALSANPNIKIVFVRVSNIPASGVSANATDGTLSSAIKWVSENSEKYSIDAVSISMAGVRTVNKIKSPHSGCYGSEFTNYVSTLSSKNVPTFVATGNDGLNFVGFPSCLPGVVGVGSVKPDLSGLSTNVNRGDGLDLISLATVDVKNYFGNVDTMSGTSTSNAFAAATYVKNNNSQKFADFLNLLPKVLGYSFINK
jgi:hypothetical protein